MAEVWLVMVFTWVVVELVQWVRKRPLRQRMRAAAIWAALLTTFAESNVIPKDATASAYWMQLATILAINTAVVCLFYWFRIGIAKVWEKLRGKSIATSN